MAFAADEMVHLTISEEPVSLQQKLELASEAVKSCDPLKAIQYLNQVLAEKPGTLQARLVMAQALTLLNEKEEAGKHLEKAYKRAGKDSVRLFEVALAFADCGDTKRAEEIYRKLIRKYPRIAPARINLASILDERGETQAAVDLVSEVIEMYPDNAEAYSNLGRYLSNAAMFEEAEACYRRAMMLKPDLIAAPVNLGSMLQNIGRTDEAILLYQQALTISPAHGKTLWNLALALLGTGDIANGWDLYGYGFESGVRTPLRPFPGLIWNGEDLAGKTIFLWREQGLGDDFRFSTVYHDIVERAGHVIIETDPRVVPLYQRTWPKATVRAEARRATGFDNYGEVDFDLTAPAAMPAIHFRRSLDAFPNNPPRLIACPEKRARAHDWLASLGPKPKIGITWRSGISNAMRDLYATKLSDWKLFLDDDRFDFVNLQYSKPADELAEARRELGVTIHEMPELDTHDDLEGVAALLCELDLTVGSWNAATELAGALGAPALVFAPVQNANQLGTGTLPWYPSLAVSPQAPFWDRAALVGQFHKEAAKRLIG